MKKYIKGLVLILFALMFTAGSVLGTSAAKYQRDVVSCDFESAECAFLAPGDYDGNGVIENADHISLKGLILEVGDENAYSSVYAKDSKAIYSDVNGDEIIDIRDLVLQDENKSDNLVKDGVMVLNGNSAYSEEMLSILGTGAQYQIKYSYTADTTVKLNINGMDDLLSDNTSTQTDGETGAVTVTRDIKTPFTIEAYDGIELQLIGEGEILDFSITRVNMDNELADKDTW